MQCAAAPVAHPPRGVVEEMLCTLYTYSKGHPRTTMMTDKWNMSQNLIAALLILFVVAERLEWNMIATLFIVLALAVFVKKVVYDFAHYFRSSEFLLTHTN